jgi:prepilin-type N-terminal cleavage/methylation domain-containing protein
MQSPIQFIHRRGFTLLEIMVIVAIIGFVVAVAMPNLFKSRDKAQRDSCIENLRQLDSAQQQWGVQNNKGNTDTVALTDLIPFLDKSKNPSCPGGGAYAVTTVGANPTCTLSSLGHSF